MNNRYNAFKLIHKGLRTSLFDTVLKIQQADWEAVENSDPVVDQVEEVLDMIDSHGKGEDEFVNQPLEALQPQVARLFEKEHQEDHVLSAALRAIIDDIRTAATIEARLRSSSLLFYAFNEYVAFNIKHMNKEEIQLNEVLWSIYTDEEIKAVEQTIVKHVPPQKMMIAAKWMIRGNNDFDLIHWLMGVRVFAPAPVFDSISTLAYRELSSARWIKIKEALGVKDAVL